ncbi:MAG TPA: class I SAM-dependent methyltransferase [Burkholderiales bacterium]|nr:class I SAM-dependent methyltransferase [Burkholderiales bacterium]
MDHARTTERTAPLSAKAQVEALFDSLALEYLRERERQLSFLSQKRIAIEFLAGAKGRLLEVGCGPAVMMPELLAMGFEARGIDVSGEMIRRACQRMAGHPLEKRCSFAVDDVERLQSPDASYDALLCMGVLEYLPRYERALAEIARVLKPGGIAVLALPNRASAYHVASAAYVGLRSLERRLRGGRNPYRLAHNRCVPWKFDRELAAAGLCKLQSKACNFMFFPLQALAPRFGDSLNRSLLPLAGTWFAPLIGAQYVVKAQKTAWRSASSA